MAIIILKGADFSANNIGQITLPENMNAFTKKIFSNCTRFSINSEQAQLVDAFIKYLDTEGLLEHLGLFMAPWLSSSLNEAFFDLANDGMPTFNEAQFSFEDGVLKCSENMVKFATLVQSLNVQNFFGSVGGFDIFTPTFTTFSGGMSSTGLIPYNIANTAWVNYNSNTAQANGYKPSSMPEIDKIGLFNIKGLSNLDTNGTTINGLSVTAGTGYSKSNEPLGSTVSSICPQHKPYSKRMIIFAGDGTTLTTTQVTSMMAAMTTLYDGLTALEE